MDSPAAIALSLSLPRVEGGTTSSAGDLQMMSWQICEVTRLLLVRSRPLCAAAIAVKRNATAGGGKESSLPVLCYEEWYWLISSMMTLKCSDARLSLVAYSKTT